MSDLFKDLSEAMAAHVEAIGPAVVQVDARRRLPASGVVYSSDGVIVTANHVVERDEDISVTTHDGTSYEARLVGRDPQNDLAVLKVDAELSPAVWGDNESLRVGNLILALGRPHEQVQATLGVVSALVSGPVGERWERRRRKRAMKRDMKARRRRGEHPPHGHPMMRALSDGFIRTDVIMYPGFSGGPLMSGDGAVHGLNTSGFGRGASIAVPVASIRNAVSVLQQHGKMRQGYLGLGLQPVRLPESVARELEQEVGLLIVSVEDTSPASKGGLLVGDIVVALDSVSVQHMDELLALLTGSRIGQEVPVQIVRGGQVQDVTVTIGERE